MRIQPDIRVFIERQFKSLETRFVILDGDYVCLENGTRMQVKDGGFNCL